MVSGMGSTSQQNHDHAKKDVETKRSGQIDLVSNFQQLGLGGRTIDGPEVSDPDVHAAQTAYVGSVARSQKGAAAEAQNDATESELRDLSSYPAAQIAVQSLQSSNVEDESVHRRDAEQSNQKSQMSTVQYEKFSNTQQIREQAKSSSDIPTYDLPSNPDTTTTDFNKPVIHETVKVHNTEIVQEVIERDIHMHHVVTKVQPVIEKVVKPARHFVMTEDGRKVEIPAESAAALETVSVEDVVVPPDTATKLT